MVYCRTCGSRISEAAQSCPDCGSAQPPIQPVPQLEKPDPIWLHKFDLIDKAGGPKLPKLRALSFKEILVVKLNGWAFLFGPFYYAVKGMWKYGLTLLGMAMAIVIGGAIILESMGINSDVLLLVGPAIFAGQANVSYYRRYKQGFHGWW